MAKLSTMTNMLRLFTLVGAGVVLGSMAGRIIRTEKISLTRMIGFYMGEEKQLMDKTHMESPARTDELDNYFI